MSKYLDDVVETHYFKIGNKRLKSVKELLEEMRIISDDVFRHYVGEQHNHFVNWIRHTINDEELADSLERVKSREKTIEVIEDRINNLTKQRGEKKVDENEKPQQDLKETRIKEEIEKRDKKSCPHIIWCMAKEFWFGMAIGMIVGVIAAKIFGIG
ncbi:hypothetical protein JW930_06775 [Candidatus Woesearchaeota archaeon]|nr:hypothetical protein [Candidatus Woesearchaeota archaeon]